MKKHISLVFGCFFSTLICLHILFSCNKITNQENQRNTESQSLSIKTKVFGEGVEAYLVKEEDIENYITFKKLSNSSFFENNVLKEVIPIEWNNATCLYVMQYENGFEVISADKRSPIPIASSDKGDFISCNDQNGFGGHLETIAEQIWFSLNGYLGDPTPAAEEYVKSSLDFWRLVNGDFKKIERTDKQLRSPVSGRWILIDVASEEEVYDSIPHLTTTRWYQRGTYNYYCPEDMDTIGSIRTCPAGCVAIAGAQMLYYLHNKIGVPTTSPGSGSCTGYVFDNTVQQVFWNYSSSTWANMVVPRCYYGTDIYAALLVGDVGKKLGMDYSWSSSGARTEDLVNDVFYPYGISSSHYSGYSSSIIVSSLLDGYPLVCAGYSSAKGTNYIGHSFLIDGYKRYRTKTTYTYEWAPDEPYPYTPRNRPIDSLKTEITYSYPHISYYSMNWGQYDTTANEIWCSLDGIWQYSNLLPYVYDREMIYNFNSIN